MSCCQPEPPPAGSSDASGAWYAARIRHEAAPRPAPGLARVGSHAQATGRLGSASSALVNTWGQASAPPHPSPQPTPDAAGSRCNHMEATLHLRAGCTACVPLLPTWHRASAAALSSRAVAPASPTAAAARVAAATACAAMHSMCASSLHALHPWLQHWGPQRCSWPHYMHASQRRRIRDKAHTATVRAWHLLPRPAGCMPSWGMSHPASGPMKRRQFASSAGSQRLACSRRSARQASRPQAPRAALHAYASACCGGPEPGNALHHELLGRQDGDGVSPPIRACQSGSRHAWCRRMY